MQRFSIAIDGPSSSGKSTLARELAKALHFRYIDSGAYYRALTWYFMQRGFDWTAEKQLLPMLQQVTLEFHYDPVSGSSAMLLNGQNVEDKIRSPQVSLAASQVSAIPAVRNFITDVLRRHAGGGGVVMDGRDIGTVVLPDAAVKIFMTADEQVRLSRRLRQLAQQGVAVEESSVAADLRCRDQQDSARQLAPLKKAPDAVVLDNSTLTHEQQRDFVLNLIQQKFGAGNHEGDH